MNCPQPFNEQHRAYLAGDLFAGDYPRYLVFESTSICNLRCPMCPWMDLARPNKNMDFNLYRKIVEECAGKVEFAYLHFFGEPLIHPQLPEMIALSEKAGIRTALSTNAMLLDENRSRAILDSPLSLLILSIDASNEEDYNKFRRGGNFKRVRENIHRFLSLKQQRHSSLTTVVQMIELGQTQEGKIAFLKEWGEQTDIAMKHYTDWARQSDRITQEFGLSTPPSEVRGQCPEPWRGAIICSDGRVVPCCMDYDANLVMGDLNQSSLKEIWRGKAFQEFREIHARSFQYPDVCAKCTRTNFSKDESWTVLSPFRPYLAEFSYYTQRPPAPGSNAFFSGNRFSFASSEQSEYLGQGWFPAEETGRWMGVNSTLRLSFPADCQTLKLVFSSYNPSISPDNPLQLALFLDEKLLAEIPISSVGSQLSHTITIPENVKGTQGIFKIALDRCFIPMAAFENSDTRSLGILCHDLTIHS